MDVGLMPTPPDEVKLGRRRKASLQPRRKEALCMSPLHCLDADP
jgi:hypothetical protein